MEEKLLEIIVPESIYKVRLDKFLASQLTSVTRAKLKRLIDENKVSVNGQSTKAGHLLKPGEVIVVSFPTVVETDLQPEDIPLDIVYEDDYLLVVNKPPGLVVHPAYGNMSGTLVNALLAHCAKLSDVGGATRPGLVHRLDKDTSGLLVVAKDDVTHVFLAKQLSAHKVEREYRAIVWGHLKKNSGRIEAALKRHAKDRTRMMLHADGKFSVTEYKVLDRLSMTSYVQLNLETGRTHQIRVHMASIGHPVFSDALYGGRGKQLSGRNANQTKIITSLFKRFNRQMLHAKVLCFKHPANFQLMRFDSPVPEDMAELLDILKELNV